MRTIARVKVPSSATILFLAVTVVNFSNFVFHMVTSRQLTPVAYGALGALLSLMLVLQAPIFALQVAITQRIMNRYQAGEAVVFDSAGIRLLAREMTLLATAVAIALVVITPLLKSFLHLASWLPELLIALDMFPLLIGLVPRAVLLSERRFRSVSVALVAGAAVRLVLGYVLVHGDYGITGAIAATVAGDLIATLMLSAFLRLNGSESGNQELGNQAGTLHVRLRDATAAGIAFAGLLLLTGTDTILARHYLSGDESGVYVAAATAARSALFLSTAVGLIAFPIFAKKRGEGIDARLALLRSLAIVMSLSIGAAVLIAAFPKMFVTLLFGDQYERAASFVGTLAFGAAALGILTLLVYFHLARQSPRAWFSWLGITVLAIVISLFHDSLHTIASVTVSTTSALTAISLVGALRRTSHLSRSDEVSRHRPPPPVFEGEIDLTVVVPFYNPGPRFLPSMVRLVEILRDEGVTFEVIAVSDGSTDGSAEALRSMNEDVVQSVVLARNWGKGEALRVGLSMGRGRYLGFIDADGDIDASLFKPFLALVRAYEPDIVLGSKRHPMSEVEYPVARRIYSWGYQQFIRLLFRLDVRDTQVGIKLIRRDVLAHVLPQMVERGFAFDLELFVVARHLGYRKMFEAPVRIGRRFSSTIAHDAIIAMFHDTFSIFYRLHMLHAYDVAEPEDVQTPTASSVGREQSS